MALSAIGRLSSLGLLLGLGAGVCLGADGPRFDEDRGHLAIVEHDGTPYDAVHADGTPNPEPRAAVASEFIRTHGDFYDFLVIFTNFDFPRGEADAVYTGVRNDVQGIALPIFDSGGLFGSASRLQGVVDMGPIDHYRQGAFSVDPADPRFRATLGILAHEIAHRWLARVHFKDEAGNIRTDLLGAGGNHWSFLLDSDASFLYGNRWQANGDGTFTSIETQARYSPLDVYLMGLARPEEVSPFRLLVNPEVDPGRLPELGARIEATIETIDVQQIIDAEGARSPAFGTAPANFNIGFVLSQPVDPGGGSFGTGDGDGL